MQLQKMIKETMKDISDEPVKPIVPPANQLEDLVLKDSQIELPPEENEIEIDPSLNVVLFRSILNDVPLLVAFFVTCIGIFWGSYLIEDSADNLIAEKYSSLLTVIRVSSFLFLCMFIAFRRYDVRYVISSDGIKALRGFLSNHQVESKLDYFQIRGTEIHRSLFERLIGTGDLHVHGSTSDEVEVAFKGIYEPYRYQKIIESRQRLSIKNAQVVLVQEPETLA